LIISPSLVANAICEMNQPSIEIRNLGKCYNIYERPRDRLLQMFYRSRRQLYQQFWALRDVSFDVPRGETIGIVGRNGSGKSTLLQMIAGTLTPTVGEVVTRGRIAALLELGSGFNPEFTGRENVYLNGALLGLSKAEIDAKFDGIAEFADIGRFIDQSVKTYSSGMMVRLAFAVQAQIEPEILIVDEALAVGDARFQAKCFDRLKQLKANGTSILLVTHSSEQIVTHCSRALLIDGGELVTQGNPRDVVNRYMDLLFGRKRAVQKDSETQTSELDADIGEEVSAVPMDVAEGLEFNGDAFATRPGYNQYEYRWGDRAAEIVDFRLVSEGQKFPHSVKTGKHVTLSIAVVFYKELSRPIFGVTIKTKEGVTVFGTNSELLGNTSTHELGKVGEKAVATIRFVSDLAPGDYFLSLGLATHAGTEVVPHDRRYDSIHIIVSPESSFFGLANVKMELDVERI
jgi:lipopolysaccharide transport system ATP-binding protein